MTKIHSVIRISIMFVCCIFILYMYDTEINTINLLLLTFIMYSLFEMVTRLSFLFIFHKVKNNHEKKFNEFNNLAKMHLFDTLNFRSKFQFKTLIRNINQSKNKDERDHYSSFLTFSMNMAKHEKAGENLKWLKY